jgi:hypothetical protein
MRCGAGWAARAFLSVVVALLHVPAASQSLWHDPGEIEKIDFADVAQAPHPSFTFLREDPSGTQPKLFVRDARGTTWNVKFGYEVHTECFCWRVVRACGYFAEPSFFVSAGEFQGYKPLARATASVTHNGHFTDARFQLRDPHVKFLEDRNWRWDRPPLAGTRELSGPQNPDHALLQLGQQGRARRQRRSEHGCVPRPRPRALRIHRLGLGNGPVGI